MDKKLKRIIVIVIMAVLVVILWNMSTIIVDKSYQAEDFITKETSEKSETDSEEGDVTISNVDEYGIGEASAVYNDDNLMVLQMDYLGDEYKTYRTLFNQLSLQGRDLFSDLNEERTLETSMERDLAISAEEYETLPYEGLLEYTSVSFHNCLEVIHLFDDYCVLYRYGNSLICVDYEDAKFSNEFTGYMFGDIESLYVDTRYCKVVEIEGYEILLVRSC